MQDVYNVQTLNRRDVYKEERECDIGKVSSSYSSSIVYIHGQGSPVSHPSNCIELKLARSMKALLCVVVLSYCSLICSMVARRM